MSEFHSVQELRDVLNGVVQVQRNAAIFALDRSYRYIAFNDLHRAIARQLWNVDIHIGKNMVAEVIGNDDRAKSKAQIDRALAGEHFVHLDYYGDEEHTRSVWEIALGPLPSSTGEVLGIAAQAIDVTERERAREALEKYRLDLAVRNAELAKRAEENAELVERLRLAVDELTTPVLEIWNSVLALPIIGIVDTERSAQMVERVLTEIVRLRSRFVIIDVTGVNALDTATADHFMKMARAVALLGAECVLTGIQPAVAQTLVTIGVEFGGFATAPNLKGGLELCLSRIQSGEADGARTRRVGRARA